jgi:hypothetical protein
MIGDRQAALGRLALCFLLLVAQCCQANADGDYNVSLQPAWQGRVKPGVPSELGVRLLSSRGSQTRLTLRGSGLTVHRDALLEAGLPLVLELPLAHDTVTPVVLELEVAGTIVTSESLALQVLSPSATVVAIVGTEMPIEHPPADTTVLHVDAGQLPHTGQAYKLLTSLLLSESALQALTDTQWHALVGYAGSCGRLYLSGFTTHEAQALRDLAGCGGRNLLPLSSYAEDATQQVIVSRLPPAATLGTLLPAGHDPVLGPLQVFLVGYVLVLLLLARSAKTAFAMLALPPAATALVALAWYLSSPGIRVSNWAETESGDRTARFAGLLQVTGTAPRELALRLPLEWGLPNNRDAEVGNEIKVGQAGTQLTLHLQSHLMSRHALRLEGVVEGSTLEVRQTPGGVHITNRGENISEAGILAWRGQRYTIPALAAGARWNQPEQAEDWGSTPQEQLLRQRSSDGGGWLLLPHDIPALSSLASDSEASGWLLVRAVSDA